MKSLFLLSRLRIGHVMKTYTQNLYRTLAFLFLLAGMAGCTAQDEGIVIRIPGSWKVSAIGENGVMELILIPLETSTSTSLFSESMPEKHGHCINPEFHAAYEAQNGRPK
jgi:hypothetical protein